MFPRGCVVDIRGKVRLHHLTMVSLVHGRMSDYVHFSLRRLQVSQALVLISA